MSLTVGQLAKLTGLTVRALHHYDAIRLLIPSERSPAGYRLYSQQDVAKLFRIQALQGIGLSLADIEKVLARDEGELPDLIAQQIAAVNEQIEQASALRERLTHIQDVLRRGDQPAAGEWAAAVELVTQYGKYCSAAELQQLISQGSKNDDAWRQLASDLRSAMAHDLGYDTEAARLLLQRWYELLMQRVGGDVNLAVKMKLAYAQDSTLQSRMEVEGGISPEMMTYLAEVTMQTHRALWKKHLEPHELQQLRLEGTWQRNLLPTVGALLSALNAEADQTTREAAFGNWKALLAQFTNDDLTLSAKVESILCGANTDHDLARMWLLSEELQSWLRSFGSDRALNASLAKRASYDRLQ